MIKTLIGTKLGMTHIYDENGRWWPITRLMIGPCQIIQVKNKEKDGYNAVQLGFGVRKRLSNAMKGHLAKANIKSSPLYIYEAKIDDDENIKPGDLIKAVDIFSAGDMVKVSAKTKGRGFTGVVKRWGFSGGPKTHGQSDRHRAPGAIGQGTEPGRIHKGKKMPGHYGNKTKTIMGLKVIKVEGEKNELWVKGAVPGHTKTMVKVTVTKATLKH